MTREDYFKCVKDWIMRIVVNKNENIYDDPFMSEEDKILEFIEYLHTETGAIIETIMIEEWNQPGFVERLKAKNFNTFDV